MNRFKKNPGFTIVELLIVIVVIAILASISIVAYSGIQQRASNAARISDARKMKSLIEQYIAINGMQSLRSLVSNGWYCLGEGYEDLDPGPLNTCYYYEEVPGYTDWAVPNTTINSALSALGNYKISSPLAKASGSWVSGAVTYNWLQKASAPEIGIQSTNVDSVPSTNAVWLWYQLDGFQQDCVLRPVMVYDSAPVGYTLNHNSTFSESWDNYTSCYIYIK